MRSVRSPTWKVVPWNDWNNCSLRIKLDLGYFVSPVLYKPVDYKTGKFDVRKNATYMDQLDLYAAGSLAMYPEVKGLTVQPELMYLDHGITYPPVDKPVTYTHKDFKGLRSKWDKRAKPMLADTKFLATNGSIE